MVGPRRPYLKPNAQALSSNKTIAQYWSELNTIDIATVSLNSQYVALWNCPNALAHTFKRKVATMVNRTQICPICTSLELLSGFNDLETVIPEVASEWSSNNKLKASEVTAIDDKENYLWINKTCGHEWLATIKDRASRGFGCPYCAGQRVLAGFNDFASHYPEKAKAWDYAKNSIKPNGITKQSNQKVWWLCSHNHSIFKSPKEWSKRGCGICSGRELLVGFNDLFTKAPELEKDWDYSKNTLDPKTLKFNYRDKAHWLCHTCGNTWESVVRSRVRGGGCPVCSNESGLEKAVLSLLSKSYDGEILRRKKPIVTPEGGRLEIDFWLPELNVAIEVQDFATHSRTKDDEHSKYRVSKLGQTFKKGPLYHSNKRALALKQLNLNIIEIWEDTILAGDEAMGDFFRNHLSESNFKDIFCG